MAGLSGNNRLPKDAQVIVSMLKEAGINDYEPRVVNQLLEFTYRYVTGILDEARVYAQHAKKKTVDLEDVKLASLLQLDRSFTSPPPRDMLMEVAKTRNSNPLPVIKPHYGLRLPPDRHCLSSSNYRLRTNKKTMVITKAPMQMSSSLLSSNRMTSLTSRGSAINVKVSSGGNMSMMSNLQQTQPLRTKVISSNKPIIKFSTPGLMDSWPQYPPYNSFSGSSTSSAMPKIQIANTVPSTSSISSPMQTSSLQAGVHSLGSMVEVDGSLKRKREPDDSGFDTGE